MAFVGHVRHATAGSVTDDNAHPFVVQGKTGEVVGVHNGSLTGWRPTTGTSPHEVDSEWALKLIADKGVDAFKAELHRRTFDAPDAGAAGTAAPAGTPAAP